MATLNVTPEYLEKLAKKQDEAAKKAGEASGATSGVETAVWVTHGVVSGVSNSAFTTAEKTRREAAANISTAAADLAAKLRVARQTYEAVDNELGGNLTKQVVSR